MALPRATGREVKPLGELRNAQCHREARIGLPVARRCRLRGSPAQADDWADVGRRPDAQRRRALELPPTLHLSWTLKLREPDPAWHSNQDRVQFDRMYEPVVAGKRMFVGSMVSDRVTAYDTDTGRELWRFFADGPVRLAPAVCGRQGLLRLRRRPPLLPRRRRRGARCGSSAAARSDRKVLGNDRLISTWPARGAPVVADGTVYFAASIWPFMGVFIHALDADTGEVRWTNDGDGSIYIKQPHDADAFAGIAPQGYLVVSGDTLLVPGGRRCRPRFDRHTGKFLHYNLNTREMGEKGASGYHVRAPRDFFVTNEYMFRMSDGAYLGPHRLPRSSPTRRCSSVDPDGTLRAFEHAMRIEKTKGPQGTRNRQGHARRALERAARTEAEPTAPGRRHARLRHRRQRPRRRRRVLRTDRQSPRRLDAPRSRENRSA